MPLNSILYLFRLKKIKDENKKRQKWTYKQKPIILRGSWRDSRRLKARKDNAWNIDQQCDEWYSIGLTYSLKGKYYHTLLCNDKSSSTKRIYIPSYRSPSSSSSSCSSWSCRRLLLPRYIVTNITSLLHHTNTTTTPATTTTINTITTNGGFIISSHRFRPLPLLLLIIIRGDS